MKIGTLLSAVGAPNVKQSAKLIMTKYNVSKPLAVDIAKGLLEYNHKKKQHHPTNELLKLIENVNTSLENAGIDLYLEVV